LQSNTTASNNTAVGFAAAYSNTTGANNTALGYQAYYSATTGTYNTALGYQSMNNANVTGSYNLAGGAFSLYNNTTGGNNTGLGYQALYANTTGTQNTAIGYAALSNNTTSSYNVTVGNYSLYVATGSGNTAIGYAAGYGVTSGTQNTLLGVDAGYQITTGSNNTIIGAYQGNSGGLDIRTASNYIVLSDGAGNPRGVFDGSGNFLVGTTNTAPGSGNTATGCVLNGSLGLGYFSRSTDASFIMNTNADGPISRIYRSGTQVGSISVTTTTTAYNTSSDQRLKENIQDADSASSLIDSLQVRKFDWKSDGSHQRYGFVAQELVTVAPEAVFQPTDTEQMMAVDYSKLVPMLVKEIQSLRARLKAANIA